MRNTTSNFLYCLVIQGNHDAFSILKKDFINRARKIAQKTILGTKTSRLSGDEFEDLFYLEFFNTIASFDPKRSSYSTYISRIIEQRIPSMIFAACELKSKTFSLDTDDEEDDFLIEASSDNYEYDFNNQFAKNSLHAVFASPKYRCANDVIRIAAIYLLYQGFTKTEVQRRLHISDNKLAKLLEASKEDENFVNLRLEIK